jgi:putative peptidoglycan lipid II flippase
MTLYFAIFSISLFLWSAQAIYARAFYAAGNTLTPMIAGTIVTLVSIPIYAAFYHSVGAAGLAIASDVGILMQTATLAILLHRRRTVSLAGLDYRELFRCVIAAVISYMALVALRHYASGTTNRIYELGLLFVAGLIWIAISALVLQVTGSTTIGQLISRFAKSRVA